MKIFIAGSQSHTASHERAELRRHEPSRAEPEDWLARGSARQKFLTTSRAEPTLGSARFLRAARGSARFLRAARGSARSARCQPWLIMLWKRYINHFFHLSIIYI